MKKNIIVLLLISISVCCHAQVGVNTTNPNAQLDIRSSNQAVPNATDGMLVPKVDVFPTGVNANQDAMLVYLTTTVGTDTPGFYYYNHATTSWLSISSGAEKLDDLSDGTLSVNYTELIPVLINAIQEQQHKIETLEAELDTIKSLEARILALEAHRSK